MSFKDGDQAEFQPNGVCIYNGIFTPGKIYTYKTNQFSFHSDDFTCIDDRGLPNGHDKKHWKLVATSQSTNVSPKYQIGDYLSTYWSKNKFRIISYDSFGYYNLKEDNTGQHYLYKEYDLDKQFSKINSQGITSQNLPVTAVSGYTLVNAISNSWWDYPVTFGSDNNKPASQNKCECGSNKTYGENCTPEMHSSWCPKAKA